MNINFTRIKAKISESEYFWTFVKLFFGIFMILFSGRFVNIASFLIGAVLLVMGILEVVNYFTYLRHKFDNKKLLIKPCILVLVGLVFIVFPGMFISLLAFVVGSFLLSFGVYKLFRYIKYKYDRNFWWWVTVIVSALMVIIGVGFVFYPRNSVDTILVICGIGLVISGIQDLADKNSNSGKRLFGRF